MNDLVLANLLLAKMPKLRPNEIAYFTAQLRHYEQLRDKYISRITTNPQRAATWKQLANHWDKKTIRYIKILAWQTARADAHAAIEAGDREGWDGAASRAEQIEEEVGGAHD